MDKRKRKPIRSDFAEKNPTKAPELKELFNSQKDNRGIWDKEQLDKVMQILLAGPPDREDGPKTYNTYYHYVNRYEILQIENECHVSNEKWYLARKFRLTASSFGAIIAACRRNRFSFNLTYIFYYNQFIIYPGEYNLDGIKAIQWDRTHEIDALDNLKQMYNLNVQPTGVRLTNSGLLGASPDGIIDEEAIVEVKCPYSFRNDKLSEKL
ncbi:uncharacterized protein LOC130903845, partial [Diorhabda carinulata]|uniref:uncharacterized protein LOC130903845 n=1 Tax=Diorhabda carinulata TaxID=1163345 RepID=UPI0025A02559